MANLRGGFIGARKIFFNRLLIILVVFLVCIVGCIVGAVVTVC